MKIVYIGNVEFSCHCLEKVLNNKGNVVGIVTSINNSYNSDYCDLTPLARSKCIPIHYCDDVNKVETIEWIREKNPDIIFCWGWSQIIKTPLMKLPPMGIVGVHPTLLPQNRGRHPLIWAIVLGLKESGLTFFFIDEGADSGPILSQERFKINDADDAGTVYKKIKIMATKQIAKFLPQLISKNFTVKTQEVHVANYWRKRSVSDGIIDWRMSRRAILNLVRALTIPYPGAQFNYNDKVITVWKASSYDKGLNENIEPGKVIDIMGGQPVIKCYDGAIVLDSYDPDISFSKGDYIL